MDEVRDGQMVGLLRVDIAAMNDCDNLDQVDRYFSIA
jgi:hypothetical protein